MNDWEIVTQPAPELKAIRLFAEWQKDNPRRAESLRPQDVRKDIIRAQGKELIRFSIRVTA